MSYVVCSILQDVCSALVVQYVRPQSWRVGAKQDVHKVAHWHLGHNYASVLIGAIKKKIFGVAILVADSSSVKSTTDANTHTLSDLEVTTWSTVFLVDIQRDCML